MTKQLLPLWPSLDGEFIVSESNQLAYASINRSWPDNKIVICGSWGKSHLAKTLIARGFVFCDPSEPIISDKIIWDNFPPAVDSAIIFHRWNQITAAGAHLCITMRKPPQQCAILPPDLQSRFNATFSATIKPPDYILRRKIFIRWLQNGGIDIEDRAAEYFFAHYDSALPELAEHARTLHAFALSNQRRITPQCIKRALGCSED